VGVRCEGVALRRPLQETAIDPVADELDREQWIPLRARVDLLRDVPAQSEEVRDEQLAVAPFERTDVEPRTLRLAHDRVDESRDLAVVGELVRARREHREHGLRPPLRRAHEVAYERETSGAHCTSSGRARPPLDGESRDEPLEHARALGLESQLDRSVVGDEAVERKRFPRLHESERLCLRANAVHELRSGAETLGSEQPDHQRPEPVPGIGIRAVRRSQRRRGTHLRCALAEPLGQPRRARSARTVEHDDAHPSRMHAPERVPECVSLVLAIDERNAPQTVHADPERALRGCIDPVFEHAAPRVGNGRAVRCAQHHRRRRDVDDRKGRGHLLAEVGGSHERERRHAPAGQLVGVPRVLPGVDLVLGALVGNAEERPRRVCCAHEPARRILLEELLDPPVECCGHGLLRHEMRGPRSPFTLPTVRAEPASTRAAGAEIGQGP
jgi:hypothetical protein